MVVVVVHLDRKGAGNVFVSRTILYHLEEEEEAV